MSQERVHARVRPTVDSAERTDDDAAVDRAVADAADRAAADQEALDTTDELLDEIDAILTEEETFAIHYLQKGGQ